MIIMVRKKGIIRMVLMTAAAVLFVAAVFGTQLPGRGAAAGSQCYG